MRQPILLIVMLFALVACSHRNLAYDPTKAHHTEYGFQNPEGQNFSFARMLKWALQIMPKMDGSKAQQADHIGIEEPNWQAIYHPNPNTLQATWIGHASFLLQMAGKNILTDPIFSERASPFLFVGPKRLVPLPITLAQLPPIDYVVISHNHYDHLDEYTIRVLGNRPKYFVPLGVAQWFKKRGITNVVEMDWWQTQAKEGLTITAIPAQHWSSRAPWDINESLWSGWALSSKQVGTIYFAGDTGYTKHLEQIPSRVGAIDLALLPIGAYEPRKWIHPYHIEPEDAVRIHEQIKARQSIGMHWGTFKLTPEAINEPPHKLREALRKAHISESEFGVMNIGETRNVSRTRTRALTVRERGGDYRGGERDRVVGGR